MIVSNILQTIDVRATGRQFDANEREPFLKIGEMFDNFQSTGRVSVSIDCLNSMYKGLAKLGQLFSSFGWSLSNPGLQSGFRLFSNDKTVSSVNVISCRELFSFILSSKVRFSLPLGSFVNTCLLYTSPSPRDAHESRMPSSA